MAIATSAALLLALAILVPGCEKQGGQNDPATGASSGGAPSASRTEAWSPIDPAAQPFAIVLLTLDTTRRDRLSCYGFGTESTPNLDRIASEGVLFENSISPIPVTLAAHASMMTGLYPFAHGVRNNGSFALPESRMTLAELLKKKGYDTGAIIGGFPVAHQFGLAQGFDQYDDHFSSVSAQRVEETSQRPASEVSERALAWIDQHQQRPFFLWAHYYDPHHPYVPPEPFRSRFHGDPYTGEIASMDAAIGKLVDGLRQRRILDRTILIVVGDHGEGLGDHVELTHQVFIYGNTQDVPFLVRFPQSGPFSGPSWHGQRVKSLVSLCDVLPTAWNSLGYPRTELPRTLDGMSLLPVVQGKGSGHDWVYCESLVPRLEGWASDLRGLQEGAWKYIRAPKKELYNLDKDPGERTNLVSREKDRVAGMEARLSEILKRETTEDASAVMDQETVERLKSLGYVSGAVSATASAANLPDPKDMIWVPMKVTRAEELAAENRYPEALAAIDSVLARHPETKLAQQLKAVYLPNVGRAGESLELFARSIAAAPEGPERTKLQQGYVSALLAAGRKDEALREARSLVAAHPQQPWLHILLGDALQASGDAEGARAAFVEETRLLPNDPLPWTRLGILAVACRRAADGEQAYRKALAIRPGDPDASVMLSELLSATGRDREAETLADQVLAAYPANPGAALRKGDCLSKSSRKAEALRFYEASLRAQPNNTLVLQRLASTCLDLDQPDRATEYLLTAMRSGQATQAIVASLGAAYARTGKLSEAIVQWDRAIQMNPNSPMVPSLRRSLDDARKRMQG